jgi:exonuclease SbcC
MIKSISLRNFQGHIKTDIDFSEKLNIIKGKTDSGKSSIIKGITLAATNRPVGSRYINKGKKSASVEVVTKKGSVKRVKSKSKNEYIVNDETLKALRTVVPDEVKDVLKLKELNIQAQSDVWFLIDESPGKINKELNKLIDIEIIDSALKSINSKIRSNNQEYKMIIDEVNKIDGELFELEEVEEAYKELLVIEEIEKEIIELSSNIDDIESLFSAFKESKRKLKEIPENEFFDKFDMLMDIENDIVDRNDKIDSLEYLVKKYKEAKTQADIPDFDLTEIHNTHHKLQNCNKSMEYVEMCMREYEKTKSSLIAVEKEFKDAEKDYSDELIRIGKCPTCGSIIK